MEVAGGVGGTLTRVLTEERVADINARIHQGGFAARLASLFGNDSRRTTEVSYAGLDEEIAVNTASLLGNLSGFGNLRHASGTRAGGDPKSYGGFAPMVATESVVVRRARSRFISTNVEVWEIAPGGTRGLRALFFPDALMLFRRNRYEAVPYASVTVSGGAVRFAGRPHHGLAESAGYTWEHTNLDGGPDRRFKSNAMVPVARYHMVTLASGTAGFRLSLMIPHEEAAGVIRETFRAAFAVMGSRGGSGSAGERPPRQEEGFRTERPAPRPDSRAAREVLGVGPDATEAEIVSAYRNMARKYHPDRVEGLGPEFDELAERRMKEINEAYTRLKGSAGA